MNSVRAFSFLYSLVRFKFDSKIIPCWLGNFRFGIDTNKQANSNETNKYFILKSVNAQQKHMFLQVYIMQQKKNWFEEVIENEKYDKNELIQSKFIVVVTRSVEWAMCFVLRYFGWFGLKWVEANLWGQNCSNMMSILWMTVNKHTIFALVLLSIYCVNTLMNERKMSINRMNSSIPLEANLVVKIARGLWVFENVTIFMRKHEKFTIFAFNNTHS